MTTGQAQFENVIFLHICRNTALFRIVEPDFFENLYIRKLYGLTRSYQDRFKSLPFKTEHPSIDQIQEIASRNTDLVIIDRSRPKEEGLQEFLVNSRHVIETAYDKYDPAWLHETVNAWVEWKNFIKGMQNGIEYQKSVKITPENIREVIKTVRDIVVRGSSVRVDTDLGVDFMDHTAHVQLMPNQLLGSGFPHLNQWLSGSPAGGFEPGTLTVMFGAPNVGKSIWLGNLATNMSLNGYNVLYISLEMATYKVFRRIGSNLLNVSMNEYMNIANNANLMAQYLKDFERHHRESLIPFGQLRARKMLGATASDIANYKQRVEKELGIKVHAIVLDYMTELKNQYGVTSDKMYIYHKQNVDDLFLLAGEEDVALITAHQLKLDEAGSDDLSMHSGSESSAITHRPDNVIGIIQTQQMKDGNQYELKNLKTRDGEFKNYKIRYEINYNHMRLRELQMMAPNEFVTFS